MNSFFCNGEDDFVTITRRGKSNKVLIESCSGSSTRYVELPIELVAYVMTHIEWSEVAMSRGKTERQIQEFLSQIKEKK